jgi:hypothetical protein
MIFLSLTTVVASAYNEARERNTTGVTDKAHVSVADTRTGETEESFRVDDKQTSSVALLKEELSKHGVMLPER